MRRTSTRSRSPSTVRRSTSTTTGRGSWSRAVDRGAFELAKVDPEPFLTKLAADLKAAPGIARVDRVRDLARKDTTNDPVTRRWIHMLPPDVPIEMVFTPIQGSYPVGAKIAEHGIPYDDDAHVPVIFYGPWFKAGRYAERALVADMAPTLARVAGVPPIEKLDGRVLEHAIAARPKK